jgi:hypothetical protein
VTTSELAKEVFSIVESRVLSRPSPAEFEMAYQIRVAIDCIRFAIKATEEFTQQPQRLKEAGMQLVDALDRLESAEQIFQRRFRQPTDVVPGETSPRIMNGKAAATAPRLNIEA